MMEDSGWRIHSPNQHACHPYPDVKTNPAYMARIIFWMAAVIWRKAASQFLMRANDQTDARRRLASQRPDLCLLRLLRSQRTDDDKKRVAAMVADLIGNI
jgi:hypothetical protein